MMKKNALIGLALMVLLSLTAHAQKLNTGPWRFEFKTTHAVIPVIINFKQVQHKMEGEIQNGKEKIPLKEVFLDNGKIIIPVQDYELTLELKKISEVLLTGEFIRHNKNPKKIIPVQAFFNQKERFPQPKMDPSIKLTGKWEVTLTDEESKESKGIVLFEQKGQKLSGTIMTPTGDYRYFDGYVSGTTFEAASFDGGYNYLLKGEVKNKVLKASILSNTVTKLVGKFNPKAELPDAYKQTELPSLNFSFPDLTGRLVSLHDKKFKNKPVIVQFFGSWCPNCMDEMNFLIKWYNMNRHKKDVEIIALAFERSLDQSEARRQLVKVKENKAVPYYLLQAGSTAEDKPMDKITGLKNFISFPTTVFLNRKHEVVKVHAGFTGPSTGTYFTKWKEEFNETVNQISR